MKKIPFGFRVGDGAVIAVVLAAAVLLLFAQSGARSASYIRVTTEDGVFSYSLTQACERTIASAGHTLTIRIEDGVVCVTRSDCPGGDCVAQGTISQAGQSIVCLPAHVVIQIVGEAPDADFILP